MLTPFPYYGSKQRVAEEIWRRFGDPRWYFEPFGGAGGCLMGRPHAGPHEAIGDVDCQIANFYRAIRFGGVEEVAKYADWPASQLDLTARYHWLREQRLRLQEGLKSDPCWFDAKAAGCFSYVLSNRYGSHSHTLSIERCAGTSRTGSYTEYLTELETRLRRVTIHHGSWVKIAKCAKRVSKRDSAAILLDPPYGYETGRTRNLYQHDSGTLAGIVHRWALAMVKVRPRLRMALCGMRREHDLPGWSFSDWRTNGGAEERIWFSPSCNP